jgi:8-oxo-dGTP pyrophosphatase MutT (NUDIX family)
LERVEVAAALAGFEARMQAETAEAGLRAAAVAVTLVGDPATDVLITRRAPTLRAHSGQWALPGGRIDPGESVVEAALRELAEELGLHLGPETVLGRLDDYATRSGFVMSPVVLWAGPVAGRLRPNPAEVAAVYGIPLAQVDVEPILLAIPESDDPVLRLPLMGRFLHAPTAAVLHQFREVVQHRRPTRVDHYEAPVFAWR